MVAPGLVAAVEVGRRHGLASDEPVVIQETNHMVVWLRPHPVMAKVGTRPGTAEALIFEHEVVTSVHALGAPVAEPWPDAGPVRHENTGFTVTLWTRIDGGPTTPVDDAALGRSLRDLHQALDRSAVPLPDFRIGLRRARQALSDETATSALAHRDVILLREVFDGVLPQLGSPAHLAHSIHGEPHEGNRLLTAAGIRWIDFEDACRGPLEWDLCFFPEAVRAVYPDHDPDLLNRLAVLNSARVATWCSGRHAVQFAEMRRHGQHHLGLVRDLWPHVG
jgi:Ser/Thr protein kinase RdoA (MazF antagonist)